MSQPPIDLISSSDEDSSEESTRPVSNNSYPDVDGTAHMPARARMSTQPANARQPPPLPPRAPRKSIVNPPPLGINLHATSFMTHVSNDPAVREARDDIEAANEADREEMVELDEFIAQQVALEQDEVYQAQMEEDRLRLQAEDEAFREMQDANPNHPAIQSWRARLADQHSTALVVFQQVYPPSTDDETSEAEEVAVVEVVPVSTELANLDNDGKRGHGAETAWMADYQPNTKRACTKKRLKDHSLVDPSDIPLDKNWDLKKVIRFMRRLRNARRLEKAQLKRMKAKMRLIKTVGVKPMEWLPSSEDESDDSDTEEEPDLMLTCEDDDKGDLEAYGSDGEPDADDDLNTPDGDDPELDEEVNERKQAALDDADASYDPDSDSSSSDDESDVVESTDDESA